MPEWLELELAHRLAPTAAPDGLWERIQGGAREPRPVVRPMARWPIAAILTLMAAAATLWLAARGEEPTLDLDRLAAEQLHNGGPLDLRSNDPAEIARWTRQHAGVAVWLPAGTPVRLAGARIIRRHVAAVEYCVGSDSAVLLVAQSDGACAVHGRLSWRSGDQLYALASTNWQHPEAACVLCHAKIGS